MKRKTLLAKSSFKLDGIVHEKTVSQHTRDVIDAGRSLFGTPEKPTRLCRKYCAMFSIADVDRFLRNLNVCCALHDIGKINEEMQMAIDQGCLPPHKRQKQRIRHEHVSAALLLSIFAEQIQSRGDLDWLPVFASIVGHHRKTNIAHTFIDKEHLSLHSDNSDFELLKSLIDEQTGLSFGTQLPNKWTVEQLDELIEESQYQLTVAGDDCDDPKAANIHFALRSALILADAVGSAIVRQNSTVEDWVHTVLNSNEIIDSRSVNDKIIQPRIDQINKALNEKGSQFVWSEFQLASGQLPSRSLLVAPCGSGKTLAAWKWLERQAENGIGHAIFLYPTRGTATEGFRDYVSWAPEGEASLMHGTAAYELSGLFDVPDEDDDERRQKDFLPNDAAALRSMAFWDKRFFSATVDQFLAFLQWEYHSLLMLPVLADAAVVIDEVHSFGDEMFRALCDFLDHMQVPVLCMTATLPKFRREMLGSRLELLDAFEQYFPDLRDADDAPRYSITECTRENAVSEAIAAFRSGQKVLCVVNTVDRAQVLYREFCDAGICENLICYHSRFTLGHRKEKHNLIVRAFRRDNANSCIAIATQVCEMGLDLDSDLLITESCPVTSLIQRMGRVNRTATPRSESGRVIVFQPENDKPYDESDLIGVQEFMLQAMQANRISQSRLNEIFNALPQSNDEPQSICSFFQAGHITVKPFRNIEDFTRPAILSEDLDEAILARKRRDSIDGMVVPVPRFVQTAPAPRPLPPWLSVAPSENYCPKVGFQSKRPEQVDASQSDIEAKQFEVNQWIV